MALSHSVGLSFELKEAAAMRSYRVTNGGRHGGAAGGETEFAVDGGGDGGSGE